MPVLQAGLAGINSLIRQRISREIGLLRQPNGAFWVPVCKAMELAAREMIAARLGRQEADGTADTALSGFNAALGNEVERLGITSETERRLQGLVYNTARAGLAALVPAVVTAIEQQTRNTEVG